MNTSIMNIIKFSISKETFSPVSSITCLYTDKNAQNQTPNEDLI